ncbi:HupE/UreJ family protein [Sphingobium sp.]|uniref:HupE/UreJ family protein n=1 Tax=Sphingobium sp. TaxID=1912891 RepID=UPI0028BEE7C4|nr:HupE/UreJ family protein [Sphingobium sp.]
MMLPRAPLFLLSALLSVLLSALLLATPVAAHTRSESHSAWTLDGRLVHMSFSVADTEARRTDGGRIPDDRRLLTYLNAHVGAMADGKACPKTAPARMIAAAAGFRRAEFQYACPSTQDMKIFSTAFFELVPTHIHFAQIQRPDGEFVEQLIDAGAPAIDLDGAGGNSLTNAGFLRFVEMGVMHIFTGLDHMAFLLGLVLISRRLRDLIFVVTGFTIGHSLTLGLAVTGIIRPHAEYIDALVALTIALVGTENIAIAARRPGMVALWTGGTLALMAVLRLVGIGLLPPLLLIGAAIFSTNYLMVSGHLRDAGRLRMVVTLVFGLIHGFGFAADLLESRLPPEKLAQILVGFNLGVEVGQISIVLLVSVIAAALVRMRLALSRPLVVDVIASLLVAIGTYWFVSRSFV